MRRSRRDHLSSYPNAKPAPNVLVFEGRAGATLATLYGAADLLILPSTGEGFPLVIQEALACGLPVLCGEESAAADPAAAGLLTGLPVDLSNPDRTASLFAAALTRVLQDDTDERRRERASFAGERYSWSGVADAYAGILHELASTSPRPVAKGIAR